MVPLEQAARKLGAWCWAERRCFEVLGGWVRDEPDPVRKAMLAEHSRHHAWRADRWAEVLPRTYVGSMDELVAPPADADVFEALAGIEGSAQRLTAHYHVLYPELVSAYRASPDLMSPVSDAPALRAIRIIVGDATHDLAGAELVSPRPPGGISGLDRVAQLHDAVAKVQVRATKSRGITTALLCWGS
ncbi:MAG: hypothetical protein R2749_00855 [Acidimicrobiales bacterium]